LLTHVERAVLETLRQFPRRERGGLRATNIAERTGLLIPVVAMALGSLELRGLVTSAVVDDEQPVQRRLYYLTKAALTA